ncbi:MAG: hypothetical protein ACK5LC_08480 [Coprobacillaceae bacterium]
MDKEAYDEYTIMIESKIEEYEEAISYLEDSKFLLSNVKDKLKELKMYSNVTEIQIMIDDIETNIAEVKIKKEELIEV